MSQPPEVGYHVCPTFYVGDGPLNFGPHICMNVLSIEPSPHPYYLILEEEYKIQ